MIGLAAVGMAQAIDGGGIRAWLRLWSSAHSGHLPDGPWCADRFRAPAEEGIPTSQVTWSQSLVTGDF
jgi:hypothetical protein